MAFVVSEQTLGASTRRQISERFVKAVDQLGSDKLDVRLGGIYGLEPLARYDARIWSTEVSLVGV
jgi:hypothetical protein